MIVTFIFNNNEWKLEITNEKCILHLLFFDITTEEKIFNIDKDFSDDNPNKINVINALNYIFKIVKEKNMNFYSIIQGLEFLGIIENYIPKVFKSFVNSHLTNWTYFTSFLSTPDIKYNSDIIFSPYISSLFVDHFGIYKILTMVSNGLQLNLEGNTHIYHLFTRHLGVRQTLRLISEGIRLTPDWYDVLTSKIHPNDLKFLKECETFHYYSHNSLMLMKHFGTYETLVMISEGLKLNYEGYLDCKDQRITQDLLDNCEQSLIIYNLNALCNPYITNIDFYAETLQELDASCGCGIDQKGIEKATKLKILHASYNPNINNLDFCAGTLEVLSAVGTCGIDQKEIEKATELKILRAHDNSKITTKSF